MEVLERKDIENDEKYQEWKIPIVKEEKPVPVYLGNKVFSLDPYYPAAISLYLKKQYKAVIDIISGRQGDISPEESLCGHMDMLVEFIYTFIGLQWLRSHKNKTEINNANSKLFTKHEEEELAAVGISRQMFMACEHSELFNAFTQICSLKHPMRNLRTEDKKLLEERFAFLAQVNDAGLVAELISAKRDMDMYASLLNTAYQGIENIGKLVFTMKSEIEKYTGVKIECDYSIPSLKQASMEEEYQE